MRFVDTKSNHGDADMYITKTMYVGFEHFNVNDD